MAYVAIYRKFRPQTFAQVKGQESIVQTLQNQIKNDRIGHAYLFTGTRGTGKTSIARIFAKAINCLHPVNGEPCNECENCQAISNSSFMDVIEIDAASNTGVDDIRRVIEEVQYSPVSGKYKVYIIDEAHMLSTNATNAFLKTLEEPPAYAIFILATTEPHKLPITILSRCQRYDFKRITTEKITENIFEYLAQEGIQAEDKAIQYIARVGDGSMRDSLSLLDKAIAFQLGDVLTYENTLAALGTVDTEVFSKMFRYVVSADAYSAVAELDKEIKSGKDISNFVNDFVWYLRNLLLVKVGDHKDLDMLGLTDENLKSLMEDSRLAEADVLMRYIRVLSELINQLRFSNVKQVLTDVALIKLAKPQTETDTASVLDRIRQLEAQLAGGVLPPVSAAPQMAVPKAAPAPQPKPQPASEPAPQPIPQQEPEFMSFYENDTAEPAGNYYELFESAAPVQAAPVREPEPQPEAPEINAVAVPDLPERREDRPPVEPAVPTTPESAAGDAALICANWANFVNGYDAPLVKAWLKKAEVEYIDEKTINVIVDSEIARGRLEQKHEELESKILKLFGCNVSVTVSTGSSGAAKPVPQAAPMAPVLPMAVPEETAEQPEIDEIKILLEKNIKMKVETEDE